MIVIQLPLPDLLPERVVFRNHVVPAASRMRMAQAMPGVGAPESSRVG